MSDIALPYVIKNFQDAVPDYALSDENRDRARSALSSIFAVVGEKTADAWAAVAKEIGPDYKAVLEELRPDLEKPATKSRLDFCVSADQEIDAFMREFEAAVPERKPETVLLTGELPVPVPANSL